MVNERGTRGNRPRGLYLRIARPLRGRRRPRKMVGTLFPSSASFHMRPLFSILASMLVAGWADAQPLGPMGPMGPTDASAMPDEVPRGALRRLGSLRFRSAQPQFRVAFAPDGKVLATAGQNPGDILFWDAATGRVLRRVAFGPSGVTQLVYSPDGKLLLVGGQNGQFGVIDAATGAIQFRNDPNPTRTQLTAVDWRGGGKSVLAANPHGNFALFDALDGKEQKSWTVERRAMIAIAGSPDGREVAAVTTEGGVYAWTIEDGKESVKFEPATTEAPPGLPLPQGVTAPPIRTSTPFRPLPHMAYSSDG